MKKMKWNETFEVCNPRHFWRVGAGIYVKRMCLVMDFQLQEKGIFMPFEDWRAKGMQSLLQSLLLLAVVVIGASEMYYSLNRCVEGYLIAELEALIFCF